MRRWLGPSQQFWFFLAVAVALTVGFTAWCGATAFASDALDPFAVVAQVDRLAAQPIWPGFAPQHTPIAIYDGQQTLLFRHPHPPDGFRPVPGHDGVFTFDGLYSGVRSNTSADIGGVRTATALLDNKRDLPVRQQAALLMHEPFHVYQRERHKDWVANEADLFLYPFDDATALQLRRLETDALRRALAASKADVNCWAGAALRFRQQRFARLPETSVAYERNSELNEGLAQYVQNVAGDVASSLPADDFPIEQVRDRAYLAGAALAALLDRIDPAWKRRLDEGNEHSLDALLRAAVERTSARGCDFSPAQRDAALDRARQNVDGLRQHRAELRDQFFSKPGWKLVVIAKPGAPLFPQGFDPSNIDRLDAHQVLHRRWLKLGNAAGSIEALNRASVSEGAGEHPIFNGVRSFTIAGLTDEPTVRDQNGTVTIQTDGVHGEFKSARVVRNGHEITITLQ
jgi:hypothetical protein